MYNYNVDKNLKNLKPLLNYGAICNVLGNTEETQVATHIHRGKTILHHTLKVLTVKTESGKRKSKSISTHNSVLELSTCISGM